MRGLVAVAWLVSLQATGACRERAGDPLAACRAAAAHMGKPGRAAGVVEVCTRAHRATGADDALVSATRAQLIGGDHDGVVAAASAATGDIAPRLWHMAGDAELERGRRVEARRWYERALDMQRTRDPRRAANLAARIADLEWSSGAIDQAIRFQHESRLLAAAGGDGALGALMALSLTSLLLDIGDVRAARATLASITDQVRPSSPFYRDYLATAGELDAVDGRPATAGASFELCVREVPPDANPNVQLRCHLGRAELAIASGHDDEARRELDRATTYLADTARMFGDDPDREATVVWLRAQVDLRSARADGALAALRQLATRPLGSAMRSRVSYALGRALAGRGEVAEAERWFREAATAVERLRDGAHYRETRRSLPQELRVPYEALFVMRAGAGDPVGALQAMERALARDFVDQLAASVVEREPASVDADVEIAGAGRRVRARRTLDTRPATTVDPSSLAATTFGFFAAEGGLWRVRVAAGAIDIARIDDLAALAPLVRAVRRDPADPAARRLRAALLPEALLPPPEALVVIIPDPFLEGVRFAALRESSYLIERHPLVLAPTFAIASSPPAGGAAGPPVVLGDPDGTLDHARQEAEEVAALLGVNPRLGARADRAAMTMARRARLLHVASHGSTSDDGTTISLADGPLGTADVLELGIAPDLVVVASCTSAATRPDAMWTSIAAAFLASGAGAVVGATGSIPDDVAREVVVALHRNAPLDDAPRALARALRNALARGAPVRAWSAFAVLGHPPVAAVNR